METLVETPTQTPSQIWWRSLSINDWNRLLEKHDPWFNKMESHRLGSPWNHKQYPNSNLIIYMWAQEVINA